MASGRQGFINNNEVYVYQEGDSTVSAAFGIDSVDSKWKLKILPSSPPWASPSGVCQIQVDPATPGNIEFNPNGTGKVVCSTGITATAGDVTISSGNLTLPATTSTVGQIKINSIAWAHAFGTGNTFLGGAGNLTLLGNAQYNTGVGKDALKSLVGTNSTEGRMNVAVGFESLKAATAAKDNVSIGTQAGNSLTTGISNVFIGQGSALSVLTGSRNVIIGYAGAYGYTGSESDNILIGYYIGGSVGEGNVLRIGTATGTGSGELNKAYICGVYNKSVGATAGVMLCDSSNAVGGLAGSAGQVLQGGTKPAFSTATYPATVAKGDVLVASADNVIGVAAGSTTAGYVLTANGAGSAPTFQAASGGGIGTLAGDSGTATGATVTIAGGTNCSTSAGTATLTVNVDAALTGITSITGANGAEIRTGTTAADTLLISAYDVDGTAYTPFITLTANNTPTMDLNTATTIGSAAIYRAGGTDVAVADGGTSLSTLTAHALYVGNGASAPTALAVGAPGEVLVGVTTADPKWLAAGTDGKVLTAHTGADPSWETPSTGGGLTWSAVTGDTTIVVDNGYIANKASVINFTLPATSAVGKVFRLTGMQATVAWRVVQGANQIIHFGSLTTTTGVSGYIEATGMHDAVECVCIVADLEWVVVSSFGNITVA